MKQKKQIQQKFTDTDAKKLAKLIAREVLAESGKIARFFKQEFHQELRKAIPIVKPILKKAASKGITESKKVMRKIRKRM